MSQAQCPFSLKVRISIDIPRKCDLKACQHSISNFINLKLEKLQNAEISKCRNLKMQKSEITKWSNNTAHSGAKFRYVHAPWQNTAHSGEFVNSIIHVRMHSNPWCTCTLKNTAHNGEFAEIQHKENSSWRKINMKKVQNEESSTWRKFNIKKVQYEESSAWRRFNMKSIQNEET